MMYYRVTTKFYDDGKVDVLVDTVYKKNSRKTLAVNLKSMTCTVIFLTAGATQPSSQNRQKKPSLQI